MLKMLCQKIKNAQGLGDLGTSAAATGSPCPDSLGVDSNAPLLGSAPMAFNSMSLDTLTSSGYSCLQEGTLNLPGKNTSRLNSAKEAGSEHCLHESQN